MNTKLNRFVSFLLALLLVFAILQPAQAAPGDTIRVSVSSDGTQTNSDAEYPSLSSDGRYVAFSSNASNLVADDTNGVTDIFVRDTQTNTTIRVSVADDESQADGRSDRATISANGQYVVFYSEATNLVAGGTTGPHFFMRDLVNNTTVLVSANDGGTQGNGGTFNAQGRPDISATGQYVVFASRASNLSSSCPSGGIFRRDMVNNTTICVSLNSSGQTTGGGYYYGANPSISADGRFVAFDSDTTVVSDCNAGVITDIIIRDTQENTTVCVSRDSSGVPGNSSSSNPVLSADGRFVAFQSDANNLVSGDSNGFQDTFVVDRDTDEDGIFDEPGFTSTTRVSVASDGAQSNGYGDERPGISADGRYVMFSSSGSNLVSGDNNLSKDLFVRDTLLNTTVRATVNSAGVEKEYTAAGNPYLEGFISADGRFVAFISYSSNLVDGDTNSQVDVFRHDISALSNSAPTDISLSNTSVDENQPVGVVIGALSATDPDLGDTHTFSLTCSTAGTDDTSFQIGGTNLQANAVFDFETKSSYNICIRADDGKGGTFDKNFTVTVNNLPEPVTATFKSVGSQDGWILETAENGNAGGTKDNASPTLRLGDDATRKQYRSILSFNTSSLPDTAVITKVTLKVKRKGVTGGGNPVTAFQGFMVDVRNGRFGTSILQLTDWKAPANKTVGPIKTTPVGGWYTLTLTVAKAQVNKLSSNNGLTQIRLRFKLDDDNNTVANFLDLFSGNAGAASRPQLIIEFYIP